MAFVSVGSLSLYIAPIASIIFICIAYSGFSANMYKYLQFIGLAPLLSISIAILCLIGCFITSDFSVKLVFLHSHINKPLIFKIAAAWGNHEGSMLLWIISIYLFAFLYGFYSQANYRHTILAVSLAHVVCILFTLFIIFFANPFARIFPSPLVGNGLNPILQDVGLALHPPVLYLGYVGLCIGYVNAVAALILRTDPKEWAASVRPWILFSWSFLTAGIVLGSWWAYRELGWGGYWFWDPVENASLIPWLLSTALLHSLVVTKRSGDLEGTSILLSILAFSLSMVGTFIVRSGLITSVHSFAVDPDRGFVLLCLLGAITGFGLLLFAFKELGPKVSNNRINSSKYYFIGLMTFVVMAFITAIGTLSPILYELIYSKTIVIGASFYSTLFYPLVIFVIALHIASFSKALYLLWAIPCGILFNTLVLSIWDAFMVVLGFGVILTAFLNKKLNIWVNLAHIAAGVFVVAVSLNSVFKDEVIANISKDNTKISFKEFVIELRNVTISKVDNYISKKGYFAVGNHTHIFGIIAPEERFYTVEEQVVPETAIYHNWWYDLYLAVAFHNNDEAIVRVYYRPFILFLWISGFIASFSGIVIAIRALLHNVASVQASDAIKQKYGKHK